MTILLALALAACGDDDAMSAIDAPTADDASSDAPAPDAAPLPIARACTTWGDAGEVLLGGARTVRAVVLGSDQAIVVGGQTADLHGYLQRVSASGIAGDIVIVDDALDIVTLTPRAGGGYVAVVQDTNFDQVVRYFDAALAADATGCNTVGGLIRDAREVGGMLMTTDGHTVRRFTAACGADTTYGTGGSATAPAGNGPQRIAPDGVVSDFSYSRPVLSIARLGPDGQPLSTLMNQPWDQMQDFTYAILPDGSYLIAGNGVVPGKVKTYDVFGKHVGRDGTLISSGTVSMGGSTAARPALYTTAASLLSDGTVLAVGFTPDNQPAALRVEHEHVATGVTHEASGGSATGVVSLADGRQVVVGVLGQVPNYGTVFVTCLQP